MKGNGIRPPAVAGMFYPADPEELRQMVERFLADAGRYHGTVPKAIVAPHAGYIYSGPIAASAYARIAPARDVIQRVILFGPAHRVPFVGLATSSASGFETPIGVVPLDREAVKTALTSRNVRILDHAHAQEHSLEVQLPFLQVTLAHFQLVPFAVGDATPEEVAEVMERLWGGPETLIVVSSDLSHYHDYRTARAMDEQTSRAIEQLDPDGLDYESACGRLPIAGLLLMAKKLGLRATTVDLRSSGDTAGPRSEVVGYGAYVFH